MCDKIAIDQHSTPFGTDEFGKGLRIEKFSGRAQKPQGSGRAQLYADLQQLILNRVSNCEVLRFLQLRRPVKIRTDGGRPGLVLI
jgi:hypothetical protein